MSENNKKVVFTIGPQNLEHASMPVDLLISSSEMDTKGTNEVSVLSLVQCGANIIHENGQMEIQFADRQTFLNVVAKAIGA